MRREHRRDAGEPSQGGDGAGGESRLRASARSRYRTAQERTLTLRKWRAFSLWLIGIILAAAIFFGAQQYRASRATRTAAQVSAQTQSPAVPVVEGTVVQKDVPIFLEGLGTVQALNTVTIRVRVDGQLTKINFTEGQEVKAGDLLAQVDPAPFQATLSQAEAKLKQDQAQLGNARLDLERDRDLWNRRVIAQQQYDTQKTLVAQLEATVAADEAAIQSAKVQLGYTEIYSPINGRIGIRLIDIGNIVHANDPNGLIVITQLHPISVIFTLPEQNLSEIQKQLRQGGELSVYAVDRNNGPPLGEGKLVVIDNQIDTTTGTIRLKANFPNDDLRLWPGQFVNARLLLTTRKNGIVVPAAVIQRGPEGPYAFVIKDDLTVEIRPVKIAQTKHGEALVDEGLQPGERVVLEGQYRLQANSQVKIANSVKVGS